MTPTLWILAVVLAMLAGFAARDLLHRLRSPRSSCPPIDASATATTIAHTLQLHRGEKPA